MTRVYRNEEVLWREEEEARAEAHDRQEAGGDIADLGTSILLDEGQMVGLNLLGTEIWKLCDGRSIEEIVAELMERFEVEAGILRADVEGFLSEMAEKGFIHYGR